MRFTINFNDIENLIEDGHTTESEETSDYEISESDTSFNEYGNENF